MKNKINRKSSIFNVILNVIIVCLLAYLVAFWFFLGRAEISGQSMEPSFYNSEKVLYNKNTSNLKRFDVVAVHLNTSYLGSVYKEDIIKRVIGLPGEHIELKKGELYINNKHVAQKFTFNQDHFTGDFGVVQPNSVFVMGDNRAKSLDSRFVGQINFKNIFGKILTKMPF